jgi:hypothetical protein
MATPKSLDEIDMMEEHSMLPWNKLEKTFKANKLNEFVENVGEKNKFSADTSAALKTILKEKLNRKQLQKTKDVIYDLVAGEITDIPCLIFSENSFSFKQTDAVSPLTSLAPKNKTIRRLG